MSDPVPHQRRTIPTELGKPRVNGRLRQPHPGVHPFGAHSLRPRPALVASFWVMERRNLSPDGPCPLFLTGAILRYNGGVFSN